MEIASPLVILLLGLVYLLGFGGLSHVRGQGVSVRFAVEGLTITAIGTLLEYVSVPVHPLVFLIVLYIVTMRVRLLIDVGNWLSAKGKHREALALYRLALKVGPDVASRQIVLINRGVALLRASDSEGAYLTLNEALTGEDARIAARHLAASYYNLGLACRRTGREAEAIRRFNEAVDAWPNSVFGEAARRELKKRGRDLQGASDSR